MQCKPGRVQPLLNLPYSKSAKEFERLIGLFAYYARWISNYSAKIRPLIKASLPIDKDALRATDVVKQDLASATLQSTNESLPFTVEIDASDFAIAASLNQDGRQLLFISVLYRLVNNAILPLERRPTP